MDAKTIEVLKACRALRWRQTQGNLAEAVNEWQRAGCPDIEPEGWQHAGSVALEVLDQLQSRAEQQAPETEQGKLAHVMLEICHDAENVVASHIVADALVQALASYVLTRMSDSPNGAMQPRIAIATLKAHFVRLGAQVIGSKL